MASNIIRACVIAIVIAGCGGGGSSGGGGSASDGVDQELERAMAFHDAAIELVRDHLTVMCRAVACPWVPGGASVRQGTDREQSVCVHGCVAVELPGEQPGEVETRFFLVEHAYTRPLDGCYVEPQVESAFAYPTPCLDSPF